MSYTDSRHRDLILIFTILFIGVFINFLLGCAGKNGERGEKGNTGAQGLQGLTGPAGQNGTQGVQGQPGTPGTIITPIKFCPNAEADYPSTFPEYGICIDNQLYAVYSANDGFLAPLPPGQYQSNAIGSSCSFTVSSNCEVNQ